MKTILFIVMMMVTLSSYAQIEVGGQATVKKINWQDGKIIDEVNYDGITKFSIIEKDSMLILGNDEHQIIEIISKDSVVTYKLEGKVNKEFDYKDGILTQKNIGWRSHGLETWFVYSLIVKKNENEFEF